MDSEKARSLMGAGEGQEVEFKESPRGLGREMVAFANSTGGYLFVGVDNEGNIVGVENQNDTKSEIQNAARGCDPPVEISEISSVGGALVAHIPASDESHKSSEGFFVRQGPNTQKLTKSEITDLMQKKGELEFDEQINTEFNYAEDFDQEAFNRYKEEAEIDEEYSDTEDLLLSLRLAREEDDEFRMTNAGVILFAEQVTRFFPQAKIMCTSWTEDGRSSDREDQLTLNSGIYAAIPQVTQFIEDHIGTVEKIEGWKSKEKPEIPRSVFREALLNAVMHRNYMNATEGVSVEIFPSQFTIRNPGGLPPGLPEDKFGTKSVWRNPVISDVLQRSPYVELLGTGVPRMKDQLTENGFPEPEFEWEDHFQVTISRERDLRKPDITDSKLNPRQRIAINIAYEKGSVKNSDVREATGDVNRYTVTEDLKELVEKGFLEKRGERKGTHYVPTE